MTKQSRKLSSHSLTKQLQRAPEVTSKCGTNNNKDKSDLIAHPPQGNLRILDLRSDKSCNSLRNEQFQIKRNQQSVNAQTVNQYWRRNYTLHRFSKAVHMNQSIAHMVHMDFV